jgi:hypothetical protein
MNLRLITKIQVDGDERNRIRKIEICTMSVKKAQIINN